MHDMLPYCMRCRNYNTEHKPNFYIGRVAVKRVLLVYEQNASLLEKHRFSQKASRGDIN